MLESKDNIKPLPLKQTSPGQLSSKPNKAQEMYLAKQAEKNKNEFDTAKTHALLRDLQSSNSKIDHDKRNAELSKNIVSGFSSTIAGTLENLNKNITKNIAILEKILKIQEVDLKDRRTNENRIKSEKSRDTSDYSFTKQISNSLSKSSKDPKESESMFGLLGSIITGGAGLLAGIVPVILSGLAAAGTAIASVLTTLAPVLLPVIMTALAAGSLKFAWDKLMGTLEERENAKRIREQNDEAIRAAAAGSKVKVKATAEEVGRTLKTHGSDSSEYKKAKTVNVRSRYASFLQNEGNIATDYGRALDYDSESDVDFFGSDRIAENKITTKDPAARAAVERAYIKAVALERERREVDPNGNQFRYSEIEEVALRFGIPKIELSPTNQSGSIKETLINVANQLGANPSDLDRLINFESGWDPKRENTGTWTDKDGVVHRNSAKGLIQFINTTAAGLGLGLRDSQDLINKYPDEISQLNGPVLEYLKGIGKVDSWQKLAMGVFQPTYKNVDPSTEVSEQIKKQNPNINTVDDYLTLAGSRGTKYMATGGISEHGMLTGGSPVIAGEAGPEAFIPLNRDGVQFMADAINRVISTGAGTPQTSNTIMDSMKTYFSGEFIDKFVAKLSGSKSGGSGSSSTPSFAMF